MKKVSEAYIVPWVLPNEEIPLRVTWSEAEEFDVIQVKVPEELNIVDVLNIDEVSIEDNVVTVKPKRPLTNTPNYFGMILSAPEIYNELNVAKKIVIEFLHQNEIVDRRELYARIFRPYLEVVNAPEKIELLDAEKIRTLPLHLRYRGFGEIKIKIEVRIGGRIVSHGESIIYELLRRLWLSGFFEEPSVSEGEGVKKRGEGLRIAPDYVRQVAETLQKNVETGSIPVEELNQETVEEIKHWLSDMQNQKTFSEVFYSRIEDVLLGLLVDLLEKHPTDNVKLSDAQTRIRTKIQAPIEHLTLYLKYRDLMENEYPPVKVSISLMEKRTTERGVVVDIPIEIKKWEDEPFMNVKDMTIVTE